MAAVADVLGILDPRGRLSRKGLLAVAGWLLAADVAMVVMIWLTGIGLAGQVLVVFKLASVWIATVAVAKRLHDLDLSAWWIAKAMAAFIGWSIVVSVVLLTAFHAADALNPRHIAFWLNVTATCLPVLGAILWVHIAKGTPGANRYGPEPGAKGFAASVEDVQSESAEQPAQASRRVELTRLEDQPSLAASRLRPARIGA